MPPSAMIGILCGAAARAHSATAVIIGTPIPATMRVVQIDPAPMPTFTASTPISIERFGGFACGHVPGHQIDVRILASDPPDHVEHALRMSVRGVDHEDIDVRGDQCGGPIKRVLADADGCADPQPPQTVFAGIRVLDDLLDVLDRDQPLEHVTVIDHEQLLDFVAMQNLARLLERRPHLAVSPESLPSAESSRISGNDPFISHALKNGCQSM